MVANRVVPEVRMVMIGARPVPYWAAGSAYLPYLAGYSAGVPSLSWVFDPAGMEAAAEAAGNHGSGIVEGSGHFDGGGFDGSGAYCLATA